MRMPAGIALIFVSLLCSPLYAGTVTYVYTDPQGTTLAEADVNGNITAILDYRPYGALALGAAPNGPGYTGHVNDADSGLVYMQARYYDPIAGRFLSLDPVGPTPAAIFGFNRYSYANDNPISNIDPDGRCTGSHIENGDGTCESTGTFVAGSGAVLYSSGSSNNATRQLSYTPNSALGAKATEEANLALSKVEGRKFKSSDTAALAWSALVQPVTNRLHVEIASKIFEVGGGFRFGPAASDGAEATVNINSIPNMAGGVLNGYIHTHPRNITFSRNDLWTAYRWTLTEGLLTPIKAYVSLPNGEVWTWSTENIQTSHQETWDGYIQQANRVQ